MRKVIISGPTGAIGMALIKKCIEEKTEVLAICRKDSSRKARIPESKYVEIFDCDLPDFNNCSIQGEYDVFYHFAWDGTFGEARNDMYLQIRNVQYTMDAVRLAQKLGCHTFIGAGSQAEYGRVEEILTPSTPAFPENGYGMAKLCAGQMSRVLCHNFAIKHIWARILSVYGPYDGENTMITSTIRKLVNGETPKFTKGEQMWDYLYSEDAADAFYLLGEKGADGKTYVLGSGNARPLKDYITDLRDVVNPDSVIELGAVPYSENQVMYLCADISELVKDTGISDFTSFRDGIAKTVEGFVNI